MKRQWRDVPINAYIRDANGYVWRVDGLQLDGTVELFNPNLGKRAGKPPLSGEVEIVQMPPADMNAEADAILTLRVAMGAEVIECPWCVGDVLGACTCDVHCGNEKCVNFVREFD